MRAKEARDHFQNALKETYGHGVTNRDLTEAFNAADQLHEALHTIELKLEDTDH